MDPLLTALVFSVIALLVFCIAVELEIRKIRRVLGKILALEKEQGRINTFVQTNLLLLKTRTDILSEEVFGTESMEETEGESDESL